MRILSALIVAALALSACGPIGATNSGALATNAAQLGIAKTEYTAEAAYSIAATEYVAHANDAGVTPSAKAQARAVLLSILACDPAGQNCTGYLVLARNAESVADATSLQTQIAHVVAAAQQVLALVHSKATVPAS